MRSIGRISNAVLVSLILGAVLITGVIALTTGIVILGVMDGEGECRQATVVEAEYLARNLDSPDSPLGSFEVENMCGYGREKAVAIAETSATLEEIVRWAEGQWACIARGETERSGTVFYELECRINDRNFVAMVAETGEDDRKGSFVTIEGPRD